MNYQELVKYLFDNKDDNFALFSKRLSNSSYISIGVKTPVLRRLIKENVLNEELKLSDFELGKYLEVDFLYFGLGLSRLNNIDSQLSFLSNNLKYASSWAITDTLTTYLKKCDYSRFANFFYAHYRSNHVYTRRYAYVLGLHFSSDQRILHILDDLVTNEDYMVTMAEAWLLSFIAIHYKDEVYKYLFECSDKELVRKTISKIVDSYRFSDEEKNKFKSLREKL